MSLLCIKTRDLSWQDRTLNVEVMMAPLRSQLLYNKHKGLKTKCQQESTNLEREKSSFLRSFQTEHRLMERRKDLYSKRRNDIILRRTSGGSRRRSLCSEGGRMSAPPRLGGESPRLDNTFLTQINNKRESKSADPRITITTPDGRNQRSRNNLIEQQPTPQPSTQISTPDGVAAAISRGHSSRTGTPGKPFLERQKSVRFQHYEQDNNISRLPEPDLSLDDKIKVFLTNQADFNSGKQQTDNESLRDKVLLPVAKRPTITKRGSALHLNMDKLETAFDDFVTEATPEGLHKLVKFATKMRASVRNARNSSIMPIVIRGSVKT